MKKPGFYQRYMKRILDFACATIGAIILIPIWIIIGIAIVTGSGMPIVYKQVRIGQNGKPFVIYKFRTMVNGADKVGTSTVEGDSRITKVGIILRKTSLDELPQLFNVIKGDMSLVGFRPDVFRDNSDFNEKRWSVKPGITGYAQVNGRSNIGSLEKLRYYENLYADEVSFKNDIKTLFKTILVVLGTDGTN